MSDRLPSKEIPVRFVLTVSERWQERLSRGRLSVVSLLICLMLGVTGCGLTRIQTQAEAISPLEREVRSQSAHVVYVTGHGWHTGLVLGTKEIPTSLLPEALGFQGTDHLEFGWGDEGVYRAKRVTPGLVAKAALIPTLSVLHVAGFRGSVEEFFTASDLVELSLDDAQFDSLCRYIASTFDRSESVSMNLGQGLYGQSHFYRANGSYYFPKTCNVWTAGALKAAGFSTRTGTALTAENVLKQARRFGRDLQTSPSRGQTGGPQRRIGRSTLSVAFAAIALSFGAKINSHRLLK